MNYINTQLGWVPRCGGLMVITPLHLFSLLKDPDLAKLLCSLKFVSRLGSSNPDTTFCETLKVQ